MGARRSARPPDGDDVLDLGEGKAEPLRLPHEGQHGEGVGGVEAIARRGAPSGRQNLGLLVQPQRLSRHARALGHLADQQAVTSHAESVNLYPEGKVKRAAAGGFGSTTEKTRIVAALGFGWNPDGTRTREVKLRASRALTFVPRKTVTP